MRLDIQETSKLPIHLYYITIILIGGLSFIGTKNDFSLLWVFIALSFVCGIVFYVCRLRLNFTNDHLKYQFIPFNFTPKRIR
ncbi:MAG: hypothetical protein OXE77_12075, partial [Flavobacteriaceae bacterium]|nr:hypothetical protein [Flavobacteriaceae bacterium]